MVVWDCDAGVVSTGCSALLDSDSGVATVSFCANDSSSLGCSAFALAAGEPSLSAVRDCGLLAWVVLSEVAIILPGWSGTLERFSSCDGSVATAVKVSPSASAGSAVTVLISASLVVVVLVVVRGGVTDTVFVSMGSVVVDAATVDAAVAGMGLGMSLSMGD